MFIHIYHVRLSVSAASVLSTHTWYDITPSLPHTAQPAAAQRLVFIWSSLSFHRMLPHIPNKGRFPPQADTNLLSGAQEAQCIINERGQSGISLPPSDSRQGPTPIRVKPQLNMYSCVAQLCSTSSFILAVFLAGPYTRYVCKQPCCVGLVLTSYSFRNT